MAPRLPVVVTRPARQAAPLLAQLTELGAEVLALPLQEIVPLAARSELDAALARLARFALVVFVSQNAIDAALTGAPLLWPAGTAVAVMGEGSRAGLAARGLHAPPLTIVTPPPGQSDSEGLLQTLLSRDLVRGPVLIVKGCGGRPWLAQELRRRGLEVESVDAYERRPAALDPLARDRLLTWMEEGRAVQFVLANSEALAELLARAAVISAKAPIWVRAQRLLVPHARIAQNATALGFARVDLVSLGDADWVQALE